MKKKTIGVLLLVLVLIFTVAVTADSVSLLFLKISEVGSSLSISGSTATADGDVEPQKLPANSSVTVRLQQKSGTSWSTIKTWTGSGTTLLGAYAGGTYTIARGTYRTATTGTVDGESSTCYSAEKTY